jgi:hypothetical protein
MKKTYMKPAISVIVMGNKQNLLTGSLGLTSEGGTVPLINYEYEGEALSRPLINVDLWEEE